MLDGRHVGQDAIVIDVGINVDENGKICGDVDFQSIESNGIHGNACAGRRRGGDNGRAGQASCACRPETERELDGIFADSLVIPVFSSC